VRLASAATAAAAAAAAVAAVAAALATQTHVDGRRAGGVFFVVVVMVFDISLEIRM